MPATLSSAGRARIAVAACFFVNGSVIGGWVPHVPDKARQLLLNPAQLGLILLAGGIGATIAMPLAGWLASKVGSRRVVVAGGCIMPAAMACAVIAPAPWLMAAALMLLGLAGASMDVAMNAQGVLVEELLGRRTISLFHGIWSLGGMLGSAATSSALARGVRPSVVVSALSAGLIALVLIAQRSLVPHHAEPHYPPHKSPEGNRKLLPHGRLLFLGLLAFSAMLSEGAVADWSGLYLRVVRHLGQGTVGYGYSAFAAAMVIGRLTGDRFVARVTELRALRYGGLLAACGTVIVLNTHSLGAWLPGFALMGIGLSNVSPILYRSAGQVPGVAPGAAIATAVGIGYAGLLIGPPLLGVLGRASGIGSIFMVVTGLCLALSLSAPVLRRIHVPA